MSAQPRALIPPFERPYTDAELVRVREREIQRLWGVVHRLEAFIDSKGLTDECEAAHV